jgi:hypothetical protein
MTPDVLNPDVLPLPAHAHHNDLQLLFVQATAAAATQFKKTSRTHPPINVLRTA